jgi:hypothetical protein
MQWHGYPASIGCLVLASTLACDASQPQDPNLGAVDEVVPHVEVPAQDGPKLVALRHGVIVRDRPSWSGKPLGVLRAGARVARSPQAYTTKNCAQGWYAIRPRGFVCVGEEATTDLEALPAQILTRAPMLDKALPYRYATVRFGAGVIYPRLGTRRQQLTAEPKLAGYKDRSDKRLGTGSNDVPIDENGLGAGPPVLLPDGDGVGPDGNRSMFAFFDFGPLPAPLSIGYTLLPPSRASDQPQVLKEGSGVALVGSFALEEGKHKRQFGVTPDGRFVPLDRLDPVLGTEFHGFSLAGVGLPIAFSLRRVHLWKMERGKVAEPSDEEIEPREPIPLTGRFRTRDNKRFFYTQSGYWVKHRDIIYIPKRHEFPDFAVGEQKWVDISLANQTLIAWQGRTPIMATLISSGEDRVGDPSSSASTVQGVFHVTNKYVTRDVDDRETRRAYSLTEVPWVMEFAEGFALTGCYWHGRLGEAAGFHNVAMAPLDARFLFNWAGPEVPEGWHGVYRNEEPTQDTLIVYTHK